jgi:hypothetical protein
MIMGDTARRVAVTALCAVTAAVTVGAVTAAPASADTDTGSTTVNVEVGGVITLADLTESFTLSGNPGATVTTGATPVTMTVTTNNAAGYTVTVEPALATLGGAIPGNTDTIATSLLKVRPSGVGTFTALGVGAPVTVGGKTAPSAEAGDTVSNDYQITIPFVAPDTYSGTLNYIATTL